MALSWCTADIELLNSIKKKKKTISATESSNLDSYTTSKNTETFDRPNKILSFDSDLKKNKKKKIQEKCCIPL